jgi:hypothetical protein
MEERIFCANELPIIPELRHKINALLSYLTLYIGDQFYFNNIPLQHPYPIFDSAVSPAGPFLLSLAAPGICIFGWLADTIPTLEVELLLMLPNAPTYAMQNCIFSVVNGSIICIHPRGGRFTPFEKQQIIDVLDQAAYTYDPQAATFVFG